MYYRPLLQGLCVLCLFANQALIAQSSWIDTSLHDGLTPVNTGHSFTTWVSDEHATLPNHTLDQLESAKHYFDSVFQFSPSIAVLLVANDAWPNHSYHPPAGMPQAWRGNVILGLGKSTLAKEVESGLSHLPPPALASLTKEYGEPLDMDLFYREVLSIHELAHLYHFFDGTEPQRRWLQELFATMCMIAFFHDAHPEGQPLMDTYPQFVLSGSMQGITHTSLEDFEHLYVQGLGPRNYEWFQMQLYDRANHIIDMHGAKILVPLRRFLIQTDLSASDPMSDEVLSKRLANEVDPSVAQVLTGWPVIEE